jgi:peptidoglycan hydrolase-like protein with peptidoglycan-binding domain
MRMGVVGVLALGLLMAACGSSEDQRASKGALNEGDPGPVGSSWSSRFSEHLVRRAQSELKREGLYEGRVDGIAGNQTKQAITVFQQREGLQQNARVDRLTLRRMTLNALRMDGALKAEAPSITTPEGSGSSSPPKDGRSGVGSSH